MLNNMIKENEAMKYQVMVNGQIVHESASMNLAENFLLSLLPEQRQNAKIIPVTNSGKQFLLG